MILLNLNGASYMLAGTMNIFSPAIALCCLLLLSIGLVSVPLRRALGIPGMLILACLTSYLLIGLFVALNSGLDSRPNFYKDLLSYTNSVVVIMASALGSCAVLRRVGIERLLKAILLFLIVDCVAILSTPVLSDFYTETFPRFFYRFHGNFMDPNTAGLVGCLTSVLALSFLCVRRHRRLASLALTVAIGATVATSSRTAFVILILLMAMFLALSDHVRVCIFKWLAVVILVVVIFFQGMDLAYFEKERWQRLLSITAMFPDAEVSDSSMIERRRLLSLGLDETANSPLVGNGFGTLHSMERASYNTSNTGRRGVHNQYLVLVGEAGVVPLVLFLSFFSVSGLFLFRRSAANPVAKTAIAGWTFVIAIYCLSDNNVLTFRLYVFLIGVSCAVMASGDHRRTIRPVASP